MKENLPSYLAEAKPNSAENRTAWFKNIAPSYAGIILWFVFWQNTVNIGAGAGGLAKGVLTPVIGVVIGAILCYLLYYKVPALMGMKSGMPLYVIGSSVFGAKGGIVMPGLLMGLLQFGWVGVNIAGSSALLYMCLPESMQTTAALYGIMIAWGALATFMGLVGIKYVAKISTYLPLIPLVILIILVAKTACTVSNFDPKVFAPIADAAKADPLSKLAIISLITTAMIGFFATAGAAGADFATGARNKSDVRWGGLVGITFFMIFTAVAAIVIVAGAYGNKDMLPTLIQAEMPLDATVVMNAVLGSSIGKICMFLLAISAFPAACFSAMIAANSFKTMLPKINANLSVAIGGAAAIALALTGVAGKAVTIFVFFGASFAPICGALAADYVLAGFKWSGARTGLNPAGWIAWAAGFIIGVLPMFGYLKDLPFNPVISFFVGAGLYAICMKAGLKTKLVK